MISDSLGEMGYHVRYYSHRALLRGPAGTVLGELKRAEFALIAAVTPRCRIHVDPDQYTKCLGTLCEWARKAKSTQVPMIILGLMDLDPSTNIGTRW